MHAGIAEIVPHPEGCAFVLDADRPAWGTAHFCNAARRRGSSYCPEHHARCRLAGGSVAESGKIGEFEGLASAVGGRLGRKPGAPTDAWMRRAAQAGRLFLRSGRSRNVQREDEAMAAARDDKIDQATISGNGPTPERLRHGPVELPEGPIADAVGRPSRPYRAVDTLAVMERRGSITAGMRRAGEDFRARFAVAQLDPLHAVDLRNLRIGDAMGRTERDAPGLRIEAARRAVWRAIQSVGGIASPAGSCLWHVLGWEQSLKEWSFERGWSGRQVSQEAASGILVAALGALESHFAMMQQLPPSHFSLDKSGLM